MTSLFELPEIAEQSAPMHLMSSAPRTVSILEFPPLEREAQRIEISRPPAVTHEMLAQERAEQVHAMLEAARADAREVALQDFEEQMEHRLEEERERARRVCGEFAQDRQRYFAAAEAQIVALALAIARRVLAREVSADTMHLQAVVRAALARVRDGSQCVVRVSSSSIAQWTAFFADIHSVRITVMADDRVAPEDVVIETEVGRVQLGVETQMQEVARGFDELTRRQTS